MTTLSDPKHWRDILEHALTTGHKISDMRSNRTGPDDQVGWKCECGVGWGLMPFDQWAEKIKAAYRAAGEGEPAQTNPGWVAFTRVGSELHEQMHSFFQAPPEGRIARLATAQKVLYPKKGPFSKSTPKIEAALADILSLSAKHNGKIPEDEWIRLEWICLEMLGHIQQTRISLRMPEAMNDDLTLFFWRVALELAAKVD